ncbi:myb-like protein I [Condylostylus longicornis]|uniref:myb-like protein I n=1 Tax=Condylostylus longicornis TaxID=2530218 RepID=UPI00244DD440|nr:myb-like protein I [Condylostylus longicornis]
MDNPNLKRRVSILKKQTTNEESSPTESVTFKSKRKISFSGKNSIKEFRPGEHAITIWETSYEESANSSSSKANNQCGKNLFKDNSIQWNLYQDYEFKQNFIAQPILGTDDKENSMYNDIKHGRCKGTRPLQDKICEDGNMSSIYKTRQNQINAEDFSFKEFDKRLNFTLNRSEQNILGSSNVEVEDGSSITLEATEFDNIVKCLRKKSPRKRFGESSLAAENSYLNNTDIDMSVDKMNTTEGFLKIEMMIEKSASKSFGRMSMMHDKSENYNQQKTKFTDILNNNDFNLVQNENRETNIVNNTENSVSSKEFITLSSSTNKMKNYNNKKSGSDKIVENNTLSTTSNNTQIIDTNLDVCEFDSPDIYPKTGLKIMQSRKTIFYNEKIEEDVIPVAEKMELEKTYLSNIIVDKNQSKLIEKRKTIIFNQNCQMDNSFFECPTKLEKGKIRPTLLFNDEMEFCISPYKPQSVKKVVNDVELNSEQDTVYPNEGIVTTGEQEKSRLNKYAENFELDAEQTNGHETLILDDEMGFDTLIPKPQTLNAPFLHIKSNNEQEAYSNAMEMDRERIVSSAEPSVLTIKNNTGKTKNFAAQNSNLEHSEINLDVSNSHIKPQKTKCRQTLFFNDEMEYDCKTRL